MDGDKLRTYIDSLNKSQAEWLAMTTFSQGKIYALFKQATIDKRDREQLIREFTLPADFFIHTKEPEKITYPADYTELQIKVSMLEERTEQYEARLKDKDKLISILERQLEKKK